jgi:signal transduction histidine kinase
VIGDPGPPAQATLGGVALSAPAASRAAPSLLTRPGTVSAAGRVATGLLAVLRASTLVLGAIVTAQAAGWRLQLSAWLLGGLACASAVLFARARRRVTAAMARWPFGAVNVWGEAATGAVALLVLATVTPAADLTTPGYWAEPYAVISAVIIAAAASRAWAGALAAAFLAGMYLLGVLPGLAGPPAAAAAVASNAVSYLAFYALARMGFRLLRAIGGRAEELRQELERQTQERARITTGPIASADRIWQIGHDIATVVLKEVKAAAHPAETLRQLAARFRDDLLRELAADPRVPVDLRAELEHIAETYAIAVPLEVDLTAMTGQPTGLPARLMAEAARELLNNASHHRRGYPASLTGCATASRAEICVRNGGPGVSPRRVASTWALKENIIHQFEAAGGSYQIISSPQQDGTSVTLRFPGAPASGKTTP